VRRNRARCCRALPGRVNGVGGGFDGWLGQRRSPGAFPSPCLGSEEKGGGELTRNKCAFPFEDLWCARPL
jgi:hypothetical protein